MDLHPAQAWTMKGFGFFFMAGKFLGERRSSISVILTCFPSQPGTEPSSPWLIINNIKAPRLLCTDVLVRLSTTTCVSMCIDDTIS